MDTAKRLVLGAIGRGTRGQTLHKELTTSGLLEVASLVNALECKCRIAKTEVRDPLASLIHNHDHEFVASIRENFGVLHVYSVDSSLKAPGGNIG